MRLRFLPSQWPFTIYAGLAAFPKIAALLGIDPIDASNIVALTYFPEFEGRTVWTSMWAGRGGLLTYFSYLGAIAFSLYLPGLWLLDVGQRYVLRQSRIRPIQP